MSMNKNIFIKLKKSYFLNFQIFITIKQKTLVKHKAIFPTHINI